MRAALTTLGARFEDRGGDWAVQPADPLRSGGVIDCGLAGTVMRFLPPIAALAGGETRFTGDREATDRPMGPILGALSELGVAVSQPWSLPFTVNAGPQVRGGTVSLDASGSSQFISGLLLSAARYPEGLVVRHSGDELPSLPHIQMTVRMLQARGVRLVQPDPVTWQVFPGPLAALTDLVEPDLTNAATMLAAALVAGGELTTAWPSDSLQAADELAGALASFGAELSYQDTPGGRTITVTGSGRIRGADLDLHAISELTPVAAALASLADSPSVIRGVAHIRGHETNRIAALVAELGALGAEIEETPDGLKITPAAMSGGTFHTWADQRMAHAGALVGLAVRGIGLDDVGCATKTLPDFPGMWQQLVSSQ